jgi:Asp-tRNA(Asn)/Glu-tRNA(Gln) amidotransferase A subunit family amidase
MDLLSASFKEVTAAIKAKKISAVEVTQFFLNRSEKLNPKLNAFILMNPKALVEAAAIDQKINQNEKVGPLAGVVFGIKYILF